MGTRYFIDETKAKGYVVVAVACPEESLREVRRQVGRLVLPGQRSVHMKHEGERRRRIIADTVGRLAAHGVAATVLDAGRGPEPQHVRRQRSLRALVGIAADDPSGHASLVLDLDRTLMSADRRVLLEESRSHASAVIEYSHSTLAAEPLLALPDVVAWCWARGGDWRRRVTSVVADVRVV